MKCEEFKRLVVDLFDREVDSNIRMECERHMASCASCREYHDELNEAVGFLTPSYFHRTHVKVYSSNSRYIKVKTRETLPVFDKEFPLDKAA